MFWLDFVPVYGKNLHCEWRLRKTMLNQEAKFVFNFIQISIYVFNFVRSNFPGIYILFFIRGFLNIYSFLEKFPQSNWISRDSPRA